MSNIYKEGVNRKEQLLFPPSIEEYVSSDIARSTSPEVECIQNIEIKRVLNSSICSTSGEAEIGKIMKTYFTRYEVALRNAYSKFQFIIQFLLTLS